MHKTGTTFLQDTLIRNARVFADAGVHIASAGRPVRLAKSYYIGNQNLAWQMLADPRFDASFGTLEDLEHELVRSALPHAVVTSEDFVLAFDRTQRLEDLRDTCLRAGLRPTIVVYLRQQVVYAKSLYAMFVVNGKLPISFDDFCELILGSRLTWGPYIFPFEYSSILEPFARCFGAENLIVRSYRERRPANVLVHDFVSLLAPEVCVDTDGLAIGPRLNEARSYLEVVESLYRNCIATRGNLEAPLSIARRLTIPVHLLDEPFDGSTLELAQRFRERFSRDNESLRDRFGVALDPYVVRDDPERRLQLEFLRACAQAWKWRQASGS
jgi:hypothetical protein